METVQYLPRRARVKASAGQLESIRNEIIDLRIELEMLKKKVESKEQKPTIKKVKDANKK